MKTTLNLSVLILLALILSTAGCEKKAVTPQPTGPQWIVEQVGTIEGLDVPECVVIDKIDGKIYISNIVTPDEGYWIDDNDGFISQHKPDGQVEKLKWLESTTTSAVNDPKGMCIVGRKLYFNDNTKVKYISLDQPDQVGVIELEGAQKLNDLGTDGTNVWVTDTGAGNVFCISPDGSSRQIPAPEEINGITLYKGKAFGVSWGNHEIFELDPAGIKEPVPFGLADNFTALDAIEVLEDDSFIVTDFQGNKLSWISADRKTVRTLAEMTSPADVGYDRERNLLYVPQLLENNVVIFILTKK